jgi:hypothetical protein
VGVIVGTRVGIGRRVDMLTGGAWVSKANPLSVETGVGEAGVDSPDKQQADARLRPSNRTKKTVLDKPVVTVFLL